MITHEKDGQVQVTNITGVQDMGMKLTGKAYGLMIDKLYTRKEDAVVRELGANARDTMNDLAMLTGTKIQPFSIQLPNDITHELIIKDNGTGLSVENVHKYLGNLFESSKENENNSIGAYGLGSKSPFAVTDSYVIESRFQGELHSFTFFRAKGGIPQLVHLGSTPTDEPNGVTFKVPAAPSRYHTYAKAVAAQLFFFEPRPMVAAKKEIWDDYGNVMMEQDNWKMIKSEGLKDYYGGVIANMGGVSYPMDHSRLKEIDLEDDFIEELAKQEPDSNQFKAELKTRAEAASVNLNRLTRATSGDIVFALFFNIGDLEIPPSRENLEYDGETCYRITLGVERMMSQITKKFVDDITKEADPTRPAELQKMLLEKAKLINWSGESSAATGPDEFCVAIRNLTWEIDISNGLPSVIDSQGQLVQGKTSISARNPKTMLRDLYTVFPHHKVDKLFQETRRWPCTDAGSILNPHHLNVIEDYKNKGCIIAKKEVKEIPVIDGGISKYELVLDFKREYHEFEPVLQQTGDISPSGGRVTANVGNFIGIDKCKINPDTVDRWGNPTIDNTEKVIILVDDKEKDLTKFGTWALRRSVGLRRGYTDQQTLAANPNDSLEVVKFLKGDDSSFEFFKAWNAQQKKPAKIWKLSELVIPKAERRIGDASMTLRGVKRIYITREQGVRDLNHILRNNNQDYVFSSIKAGDTVEANNNFMVFSDGKTEDNYLDPELKILVSRKELLQTLAMLYKLMGKDKDNQKDYLYRLTPMNIKNLDKFKEQGFRSLLDFMREVGLKNTVGRPQFQRRYKASTLTKALMHSDPTNKFEGKPDGRVVTSDFVKFTDHIKKESPKLAKHYSRLNRTLKNGGTHTITNYSGGEDIPHSLVFGLSYPQFYGKLREDEAMRLIIDAMPASNFVLFDRVFGKDQKPYMYRIRNHAIRNFEADRQAFLTDKYKEVLFAGFFPRSSQAFTNALKIAQVKLG